jgi:ELWxxDGT repeat protein
MALMPEQHWLVISRQETLTQMVPSDLTFCNGKLLFSAADINNNIKDLWASDDSPEEHLWLRRSIPQPMDQMQDFFTGAYLHKGDGVIFNAFTPQSGSELYKSDGTAAGTGLLNDIYTGPDWSYPNGFYKKDQFNYFIDDDAINTALYRTDGTAAGLKRMVYINRNIYFVVNFTVSDNGQLFYILGYRNGSGYELWHSDGTDAGSKMLNSNLYYNDYVVTIGNVGYFVAGDFVNGYELWKSDGTVAGTKLVKDINPGYNGSYPYSLYAFKIIFTSVHTMAQGLIILSGKATVLQRALQNLPV